MSRAAAKLPKPADGNVVVIADARARVVEKLKTTCGVTEERLATWIPTTLLAAMGPDASNELVLGALRELKPRNLLEAMIATQLIALHATGMRQLTLSCVAGQTTEGISQTLSRATKLLRASNELTQTWLALRGKRASKQSVVVKHVTVQSGGQAIVGAVSRKTGGEAK